MKKFMKMCGIDFLFCFFFLIVAVDAWLDYDLKEYLDMNSAFYGSMVAFSVSLFWSGVFRLFKWFKYRKSSAPADE